MAFPDTAERYIAYFDIMGFKDLIYRNNHSEVSEIVTKVSDIVTAIKAWENQSLKSAVRQKRDIDKGIALPVMFSDSILFVSKGNSEHDLDKIAYITSYLLNSLFSANVPVKGALAYGLFTANFGSSKFFGRPLVDAYLLAEEVHFYGAVLHHSFEKHLRDTGRELPNQILKRKKLPMKGGPVVHSFIDWRHFREEHEASTDSVISNFYSSVSGSTRRYVDNTLNAYCEEALRNDHHD